VSEERKIRHIMKWLTSAAKAGYHPYSINEWKEDKWKIKLEIPSIVVPFKKQHYLYIDPVTDYLVSAVYLSVIFDRYYCWEIYDENLLIGDVERYETLEEAEDRIKELFHFMRVNSNPAGRVWYFNKTCFNCKYYRVRRYTDRMPEIEGFCLLRLSPTYWFHHCEFFKKARGEEE